MAGSWSGFVGPVTAREGLSIRPARWPMGPPPAPLPLPKLQSPPRSAPIDGGFGGTDSTSLAARRLKPRHDGAPQGFLCWFSLAPRGLLTAFRPVAIALQLDSSNIESIACLASNHFYNDHPEIALRLYRRLLQMGVNNTELWNNLGLCCFYCSQYDMTLSCFERYSWWSGWLLVGLAGCRDGY